MKKSIIFTTPSPRRSHTQARPRVRPVPRQGRLEERRAPRVRRDSSILIIGRVRPLAGDQSRRLRLNGTSRQVRQAARGALAGAGGARRARGDRRSRLRPLLRRHGALRAAPGLCRVEAERVV